MNIIIIINIHFFQGGSNYAVWTYLQSPGIVTDSCYPYNIPTCPPAQQPCLNFVDTPSILFSFYFLFSPKIALFLF